MANKKSNLNNKQKNNKYNADNEIIIGVTTKPKEKVRVDKKATRTKTNSSQKVNKNVNAHRNNTKIKKNKNNENIIKNKNRKVKLTISIVLLFILIGGTIYYLTTPKFNITDIVVYGNSQNSVETYISLSKLNLNSTNIFAFTKKGVINNIKENAYVEDAQIKRKLPSTVEIYITERVEAYQAKYLDKYLYIDKQGYMLQISDEKKDIPVIDGLTSISSSIKIGSRLNNDDLIKLDTVLKIMNYCKYNSEENKITMIDLNNASDYILYFEEDEKKVYLGNSSNITEKMDLAMKIMKSEKGKKGEIFVREDLLNKNRTFFREEKND